MQTCRGRYCCSEFWPSRHSRRASELRGDTASSAVQYSRSRKRTMQECSWRQLCSATRQSKDADTGTPPAGGEGGGGDGSQQFSKFRSAPVYHPRIWSQTRPHVLRSQDTHSRIFNPSSPAPPSCTFLPPPDLFLQHRRPLDTLLFRIFRSIKILSELASPP